MHAGRPDVAAFQFQRLVELQRALGVSASSLASSLILLGTAQQAVDPRTGGDALREALALLEFIGDRERTAACRVALARTAIALDDLDEAAALVQAATSYLLTIPPTRTLGVCHLHSGAIASRRMHVPAARAAFEAARDCFRELGDATGEAAASAHLVRFAHSPEDVTRRVADARVTYEAAGRADDVERIDRAVAARAEARRVEGADGRGR